VRRYTIDEAIKEFFPEQSISRHGEIDLHRILQLGVEGKLSLYARFPYHHIVEGEYDGLLGGLEEELYDRPVLGLIAPIAWQLHTSLGKKNIGNDAVAFYEHFQSEGAFYIPRGEKDQLILKAINENGKPYDLKNNDYCITSNDDGVSALISFNIKWSDLFTQFSIKRIMHFSFLRRITKSSKPYRIRPDDIQTLIDRLHWNSLQGEDSSIDISSLYSKGRLKFRHLVYSEKPPEISVEDLLIKKQDIEKLMKQPQETKQQQISAPYLDETHPFFAPDLKHGVDAWMAIYGDKKATDKIKQSTKKSVEDWANKKGINGNSKNLREKIASTITPKFKKKGGVSKSS